MRDVAGESIMLSESHACLKSKDSIGDFSYRSHPHGIKVTFSKRTQSTQALRRDITRSVR